MARTDGVPLANEFVDATTLGDIAPDLLAAATRRWETRARVVVLGALPALGHELLGVRFAVDDGGRATGAAGS